MSQPCVIETCKHKSHVLCHCCNQNFCFDHLKQHSHLSNSQLNAFINEISTLGDQLLLLDAEIPDKDRQKLDKWRDDCYMMINSYYEEKCQELQQRYIERVDKYRREINETKTKVNELMHEAVATHEDFISLKAIINDIKQFEEKSIIIDIHPLAINKDLIQIEEWTSNEMDISTLPSPFQTINCSNENWPAMATNNRFLLMDQYPNLYLIDKKISLVKTFSWKYDRIPDMCWSSTLNSFIILTDKDGVFLVNEDMTSVEPIQTIEQNDWLTCTCSDTSLFLTTAGSGASIFEFNLFSSFGLIKQWNAPKSCNYNEFIYNINYNNGKLALLLKHNSNHKVHMELRSSKTLDRLWCLHLDIIHAFRRINRICFIKYNEWLVIDYNSSQLFHISKDGKLKVTQKYDAIPENAILFGSDILAIRTANCVNFYKV
jgi:uncharacterized protein (UPF0335 family)